MKRNIKAVVSYDGYDYSGWQSQPRHKTVEGEIQKALKKILGTEVTTYGSGRTDAGVHAYGQTFNFYTESPIPVDNLWFAINRRLPENIKIIEMTEVDEEFHARYCAVGKIYTYKINNHVSDPFTSRYHYYHPRKLDIELMRKASKAMIGKKDFRSFMASGTSITNTVKEVYSINITENNGYIEIDYHGSGFLYNMVRIMTSLLIKSGEGQITESEIAEVIEAKDRNRAKHTAPAHGLYLKKVLY